VLAIRPSFPLFLANIKVYGATALQMSLLIRDPMLTVGVKVPLRKNAVFKHLQHPLQVRNCQKL